MFVGDAEHLELPPRAALVKQLRHSRAEAAGDDVLLDRPLQLPEIHHPPGLRIDLALDRDFEPVGVPVRVRVVALFEDAAVRLRVPVLAVETVRGREIRVRNEPDLHVPGLSALPVYARQAIGEVEGESDSWPRRLLSE